MSDLYKKLVLKNATDDQVREVLKNLTAVVLKRSEKSGNAIEGSYLCVPKNDLTSNFLWSIAYGWLDKNTWASAGELVPVGEPIRTTHTYAYYGFFKPTIGEVAAQLMGRDLQGATHFLLEMHDSNPSGAFTYLLEDGTYADRSPDDFYDKNAPKSEHLHVGKLTLLRKKD